MDQQLLMMKDTHPQIFLAIMNVKANLKGMMIKNGWLSQD